MSDIPVKRPPGKPASAMTPPPGAVIPDRVEAAPKERVDSPAIEGAPAPVIDVSKSTRVAKPAKADAEPEKEHTWHRVQIDLGPSSDKIVINEQEFHHGQIATVRDDLLPVLNEVMFNTKMHEKVVRGEVSPLGRRLQR